ncbi:THO2 plays a role in transcriptional elongation [Lecanora helva]
MAPGGGGKRKRGDRSYSGDGRDDGQRPSPHRPGNLALGQQSNQQQFQQSPNQNRDQYDHRGGGRRRGSRGGRGGGSHQSPIHSPNTTPFQTRPPNVTSKPTSPSVTTFTKPSSEPQNGPLPQTSAENSTTAQPIEKKAKELPLYCYEYVTDKEVAEWTISGRKQVVQSGVDARLSEDALELGIIFQELIKSGTDGRLDAAEAGGTVKDILGEAAKDDPLPVTLDEVKFDASSLFLDNLSIIMEGLTATPSLKTMIINTAISPQKMRRELDSTLLEGLGMIRSTFVRMGIRQQTNSLYRQSNYNLLREETEGYSKLLTEFFTTSSNEPSSSEVVEETFERVKGMIGAFDLDVGRVLDITLDVFAAVLVKQYRFFVRYLRASSWWPQEKSDTTFSTELSLNALPRWALPGSSSRPLDDTEREFIAAKRLERDQAFWERCKAIGIAAFFEIGGRRAEESELATALNDSSQTSSQDDEDRKWIEITKTLPPAGNKVAAQVLGFKLRFYSSSARDPADVLPVNLIYLAALLIKVGFISLKDLYPHIWPADADMESVRKIKMDEKAEREKLNRPGGGANNALLAAAPLPDDTIDGKTREATRLRELDVARRLPNKSDHPPERSTPALQSEEQANELPEPSEQKVQLLKSLLCIGALPEALYMLGRFPWLPDAFPELPEYIHRILHHCLSKVYEALRPLQDFSELRAVQKIPDADQSGAGKGQVKLVDGPSRRTMRWAQLDKEDTNEAIDYKFYWDEWADNIPVCQSIDDVFTLCSTLLNLSGVKIGLDPTLLVKLARIGIHSLTTDNSDSNMSRWIDLSKRLIVPALSFTKCNPGAVNEVFELINRFTTPIRYGIYAEWYLGQTSRLPDIKSAFDQAKAETKDVLKRISKTTLKPMARALAKVAYANPGIVFSVAIAQLESYENIVDAVVECARYFTFLAYDVLTWSLMSALGGTGRNRVQADGMLTSKWLAALSLFAGKVFKRYSVMNPTPVVQYVADQLRRGNSTDLIILEEITKSMAGIISDTNFNESQVVAMAGGELLQSQILLQLLDRRHESRTTAKRLMKSLTESQMAGQILVSLAQERQTGIFRIEEPDAHPKLLGNLFDQLHRIIVQYLDLLRSNLTIKQFDQFVPGVANLMADFGIDPSIAFWISRPSINAAVLEYDTLIGKRSSDVGRSPPKDLVEEASKEGIEIAGVTDAVVDDKSARTEDAMDVSTPTVDGATDIETDNKEPKASKEVLPEGLESSKDAAPAQQLWHPVLREVMESVIPALPKDTYEIVGLPFYVTFWYLSLSDFQPPMSSYVEEINRQTKKIQSINSDRSDVSIAGTRKKEQQKHDLNDLQDRLRSESTAQINLYQKVRARNLKEKNHWFAGLWGKWDALNVALIEHCFFPRIVMSPLDALYTFKMFTFLHSNGATNFRTMGVLDQIFREKRLTSMLFLCSAKEAENLGRFFNEILRLLSRWHADKAVFEKEAFGTKRELPGFTLKMSTDKSQFVFLDYEDFRRILLKWHRNLSFAIKGCISSGEYMHIRNAVNVLNNIHQHFPAVNWMGQNLLNSITELSTSEKREDLKVAAMSVMGALKRREKDWVLPQAFNLVNPAKSAIGGRKLLTSFQAPTENGSSNTNGGRSTSAKPATPQPGSDSTKALNPKAPDFRPSPRPSINGIPKVDGPADRIDAEDGEIEDAKVLDGSASNSVISASTKPAEQGPGRTGNEEEKVAPSAVRSETSAVQRKESPAQTSASQEALSAASLPKITSAPPLHSLPPARPDLSWAGPSDSSGGRALHNLPSKPEPSQVRPGDHRMTSRSGERYSHDTREPRYPQRGEPRDTLRDKGFNHFPSGSFNDGPQRLQDGERDRVSHARNSDRPHPDQGIMDDRHTGQHNQEPRYSMRDDKAVGDRRYIEQHHNRREVAGFGQQQREISMPPPRPNVSQHPINPERAALIQGNHTPDQNRRPDPSAYDHQQRPLRTSRGPSPPRMDDHQPLRHESRREEPSPMYGRRPLNDNVHRNPQRFEDSSAPTGPRTSQSTGSRLESLNPGDRPRDPMRANTIAPPLDSNHGRLNHESSFPGRQGESQYGRLNSDNDIPSGPRMPNGNHPVPGRGSRNISAPQPQLNTQISQNHGPTTAAHDRQAPSGPSMRGSPRKPPPFSQHNGNSSAPPTPVAQSPDTAGVHPDRLKALQASGAVAAENTPPNQRGVRQGPPPLSMPPRGPNNNQLPSPIGPSSGNRGPPTGPAMPNDRMGRDQRNFAGVQNTLQKALGAPALERSGQGASIRGRGGRANNVSGPSPGTSTPLTPNLPRQDQIPPREDLFANRPNGTASSYQAEEDMGSMRGGRRGGPRDFPRDGDRRSGRHRSRSPTKDRIGGAPQRVRDDDMGQGRDGPRNFPRNSETPSDRDGRGASGSFEANIRGPPDRDLRDRGPPRDTRRSGRDDGQFRERRGEPDMRDDRERRDGGRKRGRGDEGQGERNFSDKRPRR